MLPARMQQDGCPTGCGNSPSSGAGRRPMTGVGSSFPSGDRHAVAHDEMHARGADEQARVGQGIAVEHDQIGDCSGRESPDVASPQGSRATGCCGAQGRERAEAALCHAHEAPTACEPGGPESNPIASVTPAASAALQGG